jgi:long-chain acyl-CoA synthetase
MTDAVERPALKKVAELHPTLNLGDFIEATRTVPESAIALIDLTVSEPKTLTYADLEHEIRLCVGAFRALGVKRGTRFALALPNCRLFLIGFLALMRLGAIPVFINSHLSNDALRHIVTDSGSEGILADLEDAPPLSLLAAVPALRWRLSRSGEGPANWYSWPAILDGASPDETVETMAFDDQAFQPYTAGSTGMPKGIVLTHGGMLWGIEHSQMYYPPPPDERGIVAAPMFHKNAMRGVIKPMLRGGCSVVVLPEFEPRQFLKTMSTYRVTSSGGVPAMYADILREDDLIRSLDFSALKLLSMGSATVPAELSARLARAFPHVAVKESYGMTEVGGPTRPLPGVPTPLGSVGVIAPEYEAKLVDDAGNEGAMAGELHLRAPYVLKAYAGLPEMSAARIYDGWLRTGDKFRKDEQGFLYFIGRADDMFSCGGENIYPKEVENLILKLPDVGDAIVVPLPHETKSFAPTAMVLPRPGCKIESKAIQDFCAANGPAFAIPRAVLVVTEIPRTSAGKPDRKAAQALMSRTFGTLKSRSRKG